FIELCLVTALALFFSTFSTPLLSAALTFGFFVAGRLSNDLRNFDDVMQSSAGGRVAQAVYWVLPHLEAFNVRAQVVHGQPVPVAYLAMTAAYGVLYIAALLVPAAVIFSRRDFK